MAVEPLRALQRLTTGEYPRLLLYQPVAIAAYTQRLCVTAPVLQNFCLTAITHARVFSCKTRIDTQRHRGEQNFP